MRGKTHSTYIKVKIKDYLWDEKTGLPESFVPDEVEGKEGCSICPPFDQCQAPHLE